MRTSPNEYLRFRGAVYRRADRKMTRYVHQRDYLDGNNSCCGLIALVNAAHHHGLPTPDPGTDEWERLVRTIACDTGTAIRYNDAAALLGLRLVSCGPDIPSDIRLSEEDGLEIKQDLLTDAELPVMVSVDVAEYGRHACLIVGGDSAAWTLVNYRSKPVETVPIKDVEIPRWSHQVRFKSVLPMNPMQY